MTTGATLPTVSAAVSDTTGLLPSSAVNNAQQRCYEAAAECYPQDIDGLLRQV